MRKTIKEETRHYIRDGKVMAQSITDFVNGAHNDDSKAFVDQMLREHRTLQQGFMRMVYFYMKALVEQKHYDGRNEASYEFCKEVLEKVDESKQFFPLI